ncbi:MAG: GNAT family N-acetyltransferase [Anaerolineales bacterium]
MIQIASLQPHQVTDAKLIISAVAQRIYYPEETPQFFYDVLEKEGELHDVDNFEQEYVHNHGLFLVMLDDGNVVGTGALKRIDKKTAELKRLWLLESYHGQKIGYRVVMQLLEFARANGYEKVRLQTGTVQVRAVEFYKKLGFYEIESYRESMDNLSMEMKL